MTDPASHGTRDTDGLTTDPIAIVGIGCRFPGGAHSASDFWRLLCGGVDAIGEVPPDRWDVKGFYDPDPRTPAKTAIRAGGYVQQRIEEFDAAFFGISPREAACLDPQQRLLLEVTWEALEDAGIPAARLAGGDTGVYAGGFMQDSASLQMGYLSRDLIGPHTSVGASLTMLSARISYALDLRGPCISVDTACSASLVATHYACNGLWNRECSHALVAGVNVMLNPAVPIALTKAGFLSPDARCKAFDARANGYVRSEGAGVVVLKRLSDALRDRDRVYSLVRGSAVNQDGRSDGITQPNQDSQEALLREAYRRAGISPRAVHYVEAHGTGTPVGDRTEAGALGAVVGAGRDPATPCVVGSVKTNVGHMEGAAGVGGLIKAALAIAHGQIPPNLHFQTPSPAIPFDEYNLRIPQTLEPWPPSTGPRLASVNSFGYGGTNAHVVLEEAPSAPSKANGVSATTATDWLIPISAKTPNALRAFAASLAGRLIGRRESDGPSLEDLAYSAAVRRSHHEHRGALVVRSLEDVVTSLKAYAEGNDGALTALGHASVKPAKIAFVYTGMGPQWWAMGRDLFDIDPAFRDTAFTCDRVFQALGAGSVLSELLAGEGQSRMSDPFVAQATNFLLQVALTSTWEALGVRPDVVIGHSAGEAAAAYAAGALTLDDATRVCFHRARLQARAAGRGRMLAVGLSAEEALALIAPHEPDVCLAAINGPSSVALSGCTATLEAIARDLEERQVFHRLLHGDVPYHSRSMDPFEAELRRALESLEPHEARCAFYSTVVGSHIHGPELHADYWWRNVRNPVEFAAAIGRIVESGPEPHLFVEIGPHPVLSTAVVACANVHHRAAVVVPSLHRERHERATLLSSLGRLFVEGAPIDFDRHASPSARFFPLPAYPWQRERHWLESPAARQDRLGTEGHPLLRRRVPSATPTWEAELCTGLLSYLPDHRVQGEIVFPGAAYVDAAMAMHRELFGSQSFTLERLDVQHALVIPAGQLTVLRLSYEPEGGSFAMHSYQRGDEDSWVLHASGHILQQPIPPRSGPFVLGELLARCKRRLDTDIVYASLEQSGFQYGPWFQGIREIWCDESGEALARVRLSAEPDDAAHYIVHPALLDACFQTLVATISKGAKDVDPTATYLPVGIDEIRVSKPAPPEIWAYGRFTRQTEHELRADLWMLDDSGAVVAELRSVRARALPKPTQQRQAQDDWFYQLRWEAQELASPEESDRPSEAATWLLFTEESALTSELATELAQPGRTVVTVTPARSYERVDACSYRVRPDEPDDMRRLVDDLAPDKRSLDVAYLWPIDPPRTSAPLDITGIEGSCRLLGLVQALTKASAGGNHRIWVVTNGAQRVDGERLAHAAHAPLWAMARMSNVEHRQLRCVCVDLDPSLDDIASQAATLALELTRGGGETEVALRAGARYVPRLERISRSSPARNERVSSSEVSVALKPPARRGRVAEASFERVTRPRPGPGQIEIEVRAAGVNLKDIAKLRGLLTDADLEGSFTGRRLGMDCSGVVTAVGEGVTGARIGDAVIAFAPGCLASHVLARAVDVWPKPPELGFEEATGLCTFVYAIYALGHVARLRANETVLIHSAAGGTGLAALMWAQHLGAEVLATAGSDEKRALLASLGVSRVMDSRSLAFTDEVLEHTAGRGVDVVLNTLTGEGLRRSLSLLAPNGRFVDLTYFGNRRFELLPNTFPRNVSLLGVDLDSLFVHRPDETAELMLEVSRGYDEGVLLPLPITVFAPSDIASAFAHLSERRNVGRAIVGMSSGDVRVPPSGEIELRADATYLVTGGLGGFGLATAAWLADHGARHLVLVGRSGASSDAARRGVASLEEKGVVVKVVRADVARRDDVERVLDDVRATLPPLRGVVHAAAVFGGEFMVESSAELLRAAMMPKVLGAWHLHELTRETPLDFFVLYSSVAGTLGETGTAAYSAANAFLDGLAHLRQSQGLPAISMGWGLVGDVGIGVADERIGALVRSVGHRPMMVKDLLSVLGEALATQPAHLFVTDTDWARWALTHPLMKAVPRLSLVITDEASLGMTEGGQNFREALQGADGPERERLVLHQITQQLATVLRTSADRIDVEKPLGDLGIDSLMASELSVRLERDTGVMVPMMTLMRRATLRDVAQRLLETLVVPSAGPVEPVSLGSTSSLPPAPLPAPKQHSFRSEDGFTVFGHLSVPPGPGPHPTVVVHTSGLGGALDAEGTYANLLEHGPLTAGGHAVFTVDQRGAPGHGERYARLGTMGGDEIGDLVAAARYLSTLPGIDASRLAIMGTSRGAYAALLAACRAPDVWNAVVLLMGFYDPVAFVQHERRVRPDTSLIREHARQRWEDIEWYFSDDARRPLSQIDRLRGPLFVVHGDADDFVDPSQALELAGAARSNDVDVEIEIVSDMDHDLEQRHPAWPDLWVKLIRFLNRQPATSAFEAGGAAIAREAELH